MNNAPDKLSLTRHTLFFACLLLFFFQLFGIWVESMYRVSLVRLGPGGELTGLLLILLALPMLGIRARYEITLFRWAFLLFLLCRFACPFLGTTGRIVVGGVGLALFIVLFAYIISDRYRWLQGDPGWALGMAVLASILLRAWGSSVDVSVDGMPLPLGGALVMVTFLLFLSTVGHLSESGSAQSMPRFYGLPAMLALFANFTLVFLCLSCPLVVCAWYGYTGPWLTGAALSGTVIFSFCMFLACSGISARVRRLPILFWNVAFVLLLLAGLFAGRPSFPATAGSPALLLGEAVLPGRILAWMALLVSPVVLANVRKILSGCRFSSPRNALLPVLGGFLLLLALAELLILTNVWGYIPFGSLFRNRFYLPFLIAGMFLPLPWLVPVGNAPGAVPLRQSRLLMAAAAMVALWLGAVVVHMPGSLPAPQGKTFTVMTYNMQQGSHESGDRNYRQQCDLLRQINPDIIGLQECDTTRPSGAFVDTVRFFAESLGYYACYGPGSISGTYGTAILSRFPLRNPRVFFTYSHPDEIGTVAADMEVDGIAMTFSSNHPAGGMEVTNAHVDALIKDAGGYKHAIAVGDYNFTAREPFYQRLSQALPQVAARTAGSSFPTPGNFDLEDAIDHIFTTPNFRILQSHYLPPPFSQTDHPAHWAVLEIRP